VGIVFTFCDNDDMKKLVNKTRNPDDGKEIRWRNWLGQLKKVCKQDIFQNMADDHVFFFNANGGTTGP